jgi:hypothetical protein
MLKSFAFNMLESFSCIFNTGSFRHFIVRFVYTGNKEDSALRVGRSNIQQCAMQSSEFPVLNTPAQ